MSVISEQQNDFIPSPKVPEPEKVRRLFNRLAPRYDRFNAYASLGLDKIWRKTLIQSVLGSERPLTTVLDIGTGTGDLIVELGKAIYKRAGAPGSAQKQESFFIGLDFSENMLDCAKIKLERSNFKIGEGMTGLLHASAGELPLADRSIDVILSAFTLRNVKKIMRNVLQEMHRVLRPGGQVFLLEMYVPENNILNFFHKIYLQTVLPAVGKLVFGADSSGHYLPDTIFNFGSPGDFSHLLQQAGFTDVRFRLLNGGIAAVHVADNPVPGERP